MPRPLRAYYHPRKGAETRFLREGTILCPGVPLATINVQAGVSDRPRSLDRMSLPSDGLAPSKPSPQFTGERIGSTEKDVGATRAIAIDARRLHRAANGINRANKAAARAGCKFTFKGEMKCSA